MPVTNAGAGRIARLHRLDRLDGEEHSITLHLISEVYSSGGLWRESRIIFLECGVFEGVKRSGLGAGARRTGRKTEQ